MLTIVIKAYCVNVMVDIKPIYLDKHYLFQSKSYDLDKIIVIRDGKIVWKQGPNWPFYALMLRTKLYQNQFFFTGDQNVNKPKSRAVRTVYGPIFLPFYKIIVSFFFFFLSRCKQNKIEPSFNWLQFVKETQTKTVQKGKRRAKLHRL